MTSQIPPEAFLSPEDTAAVKSALRRRHKIAGLLGGLLTFGGALSVMAGIAYGELQNFTSTEAAVLTDTGTMNSGLNFTDTANLLIETGAGAAGLGISIAVAAHELGRRREEDLMVAKYYPWPEC